MAFTGTLEKCKACEKTVYHLEMISADGVQFHKNCFKCSQCNGKLTMSTYSSLDGVLYCKPHFEQMFKENGGLPKVTPSNKPQETAKAPSKFSLLFSGTQDKCAVCKKTVYPLEKVTVEGDFYHKSCFRCTKGGCHLTPSNYAALDGNLFCKPHFSQLFKEKGSYAHLAETAKKSHASTATEEETKAEEAKEEETTTKEAAPEEEEKEEEA